MLSQVRIDIIIRSMMPYNPVRIAIFGSVARGEDTEKSDVDILYRLEKTVGLFNLIRIKDDLEQKLNRKVDLVSERFVHPKLQPYIMKDLKIIYDNGNGHACMWLDDVSPRQFVETGHATSLQTDVARH